MIMLTNKSNIIVKHKFVKVIACLSTLLFSSVSIAVETVDNVITQSSASIETLHGLNVTERAVIILVTSTGCTEKEDFTVVLDKSAPPKATFIRLKPDFCRAVSRTVPIKFSLQEVGIREFLVTNTIKPGSEF